MDNLLTRLNIVGNSIEHKLLRDLETNKPFKTSNWEFINTKFGVKLIVVLDNKFKVVLPDRFNNFNVTELNKSNLMMTYKGLKKMGNGNSLHLIDFHIREEDYPPDEYVNSEYLCNLLMEYDEYKKILIPDDMKFKNSFDKFDFISNLITVYQENGHSFRKILSDMKTDNTVKTDDAVKTDDEKH